MAGRSKKAPPSAVRGAFRAQYETLSSRDRKLLSGLLIFLMLVSVGGLGWVLKGKIDTKAALVKQKKDDLHLVELMDIEYEQEHQRIAAAEERIKRSKGQALETFVEKSASASDVRGGLRTVTPQGSEVEEGVKSTRYKVELKKVQFRPALDFLHTLESGDYPLRVGVATMKATKSRGEIQYDLTLELVVTDIEAEG